MIKSFRDRHTERLYNQQFVKRFSGIERQALTRLRRLDAATILSDLVEPPSNHFEALRGDRQGQYSIRINDQWRICFRWEEGPVDVEIVDYHQGTKMKDWRAPIHPGEILAEELDAIEMSTLELANRIDLPDNQVYQIIHEQRDITADTALRLGKFFNTTAEYWLNLQKLYELDVARSESAEQIAAIQPFRAPIAINEAVI